MSINALDTCNACDAIGVDPDSLAGYCSSCEAEAHGIIRFQRDRLGMVDWAHLPTSIFSLARFQDGTVYLVANAASGKDGSFHKMHNPRFDYAESYAAFKRLAEDFQAA